MRVHAHHTALPSPTSNQCSLGRIVVHEIGFVWLVVVFVVVVVVVVLCADSDGVLRCI